MPTGVYKRKPCQEKTKDKLRVAMKKRIATLGHMNSPETRKKMRLSHKDKKPANWDSVKHLFLHSFWTGKKRSKTTNDKIREKLTGRKISAKVRENMSLSSKKGKDSHLWKGGITSENHRIRSSIEMKLWRQAVFARDNWVCQICGKRGTKINAHHIKDFSTHKDGRTSIENGITLCVDCHRKFHKEYGISKNNQKQMLKFKEGYREALKK